MKRIYFVLVFASFAARAQNVLSEADALLIAGENEKAIAAVDRSLNSATPEAKIFLLNKKAEAQTRAGRFEEADATLDAIATNGVSPLARAATLATSGFHQLNKGRTDLALESLSRALEIYRQQGADQTLDAARAINYLGLLYKATNKQTQAEEQLLMALQIREKLLNGDHELVAASYNDLGFAYTQADNDKALDYYEKALAIYTKLHGERHSKIAIANTNIGFIYRELELYGDAINYLETALKTYESLNTAPSSAKAFVLFNLGKTYLKMADRKTAHSYFENALSMYRQVFGDRHPELSSVLNSLAALDITVHHYDEGLKLYQQSLIANSVNFKNTEINSNPEIKDYYSGNVLLYTLLLKAQALEARHYGKTLNFSDLYLSLTTLQRCDSLIDILRQQTTNESDKIALGAIANEVYADGVRISFAAYEQAFKKSQFKKLAFYFAEKSKSAVLLEAIAESDAKSFAGIPQQLVDEEKDLKAGIALASQKLAQKPSVEEEAQLRTRLFALNRRYESFVSKLETQFPDYYDLKYSNVLPTADDMQKLLKTRSAVISYFIDEKNGRLYIFVVTHNKFKITSKALPSDFDKMITGMRNGIYYKVTKPYASAAAKLHRLLIPHLAASINELTILPTSRLSVIPFEALLSRSVQESTPYSSLPYLIRDYSIQYEFSAGLILQKSRQPRLKKIEALLCAPISFPEKDNLNDLPGSETEVKAIAQLFASKDSSSTLYTGMNANEHAIKTQPLNNFGILHFATHGIVDEKSPELSRIYLQNDDNEDGNLFSGEIYNLKMQADLVTLSACQTGLGKISKGEGVIGLSRALVYAGARNIIVSFWSVADESTSLLMQNFYRRVLEYDPPAYAANLRSAKLDLIGSQEYSSPFYWAAFILIGY